VAPTHNAAQFREIQARWFGDESLFFFSNCQSMFIEAFRFVNLRCNSATTPRLSRARELTAAWVPDERHEAMRKLSRARRVPFTPERVKQALEGAPARAG